LLYRELNNVLRGLKDVGIQVIALKGAALAETVYPTRALRPMSDVDLLIRKEELPRVEDKLIGMGYLVDEDKKAWFKEYYFNLDFSKNEAPSIKINLDIHWDIHPPSGSIKIDIDGMWERALTVKIANSEAMVLSPEDLLLHLCHHASCSHILTGGLRPLCDIYETVQYYNGTIDWEQVQTRSFQWRINKYVHIILCLAKELLGAAVPDAAVEALQPDHFDARLLGWAREKIVADRERSHISSNIVHFWRARRLKEKLAVSRQIFSPEVIARNYSVPPTSNKLYFYYLVRLKDLFIQYGPLMARLFCRDERLTALVEREHRLDEWLAPSRSETCGLPGR
ncbi:MAG TPA: nucleotidyltransferase family protein, partial [Candidatus Binatia bacterium]|nr:nucleotidyltransferase family protein [Candidatus Binatia bacterium]